MAYVSSFLFEPLALPDWQPRAQQISLAPNAAAEPAHPIDAAGLGAFVTRLWQVCGSAVCTCQHLRLSCVVEGEPPTPHVDAVVRLATFLASDAADCCFGSATSRITLRVESRAHQVALMAEHDGWSQPRRVDQERKIAWARRIAEASGGTLSRRIDWDRTITRIVLPRPGRSST